MRAIRLVFALTLSGFACGVSPTVKSPTVKSPTLHSPPAHAPAAATPMAVAKPSLFTQRKVMIPMRDGVHLETVIYAPREATKPLPILFRRSPYGIMLDEAPLQSEFFKALRTDGYIFVFQNLRGRFGSEGIFVMDRPPRDPADTAAIDEASDAYDSIEWLLHNVPNNNGRVGMDGTSFDALTAMLAAIDPHPALKVVVEEASPADQFIGDDFHHNGAFRLAYGFEYVAMLESSKTSNTKFSFGQRDLYDFYLDLGPLANADKHHFHGAMPTWNDFVAHPNYDSHWQAPALASFITKPTKVPVLHCVGFWDQEDFYGPLKAYELLEKHDADNHNRVIIGPWNHGGWYSKGRRLGPIDFASNTGEHYRNEVKYPWLAHFLHDKPLDNAAEAIVFETGSNHWRTFAHWPPQENVTTKRLYLRSDHGLSFTAPTERGRAAVDEYVSDPSNPVPYSPRPIDPLFSSPRWPQWQVDDQRFVDHRPDVLTYLTAPLEEPLTIAGNVEVELYAATTGSDSDWIVKWIDVFSETAPPKSQDSGQRKTLPNTEKIEDLRGYQLMLGGEVFRGRFRQSFEKPTPIVPNQVNKYTIKLHGHAHTFQKGHRIMLQVQSTWFPLIDRNPQRYVDNIFTAQESDYIKATQRIWHSAARPSAIVLPVLNDAIEATTPSPTKRAEPIETNTPRPKLTRPT